MLRAFQYVSFAAAVLACSTAGAQAPTASGPVAMPVAPPSANPFAISDTKPPPVGPPGPVMGPMQSVQVISDYAAVTGDPRPGEPGLTFDALKAQAEAGSAEAM